MFFLDRLEATGRAVDRGVLRLLFVLGISMTFTVAVQVFFRYGLNRSLFWSEEAARCMLVWLTFLGATTAHRRGMHPGVDALTARMPQHLKRYCAVTVHLVCIGFFSAMIVYGVTFAHFVRMQITPALGLPKWLVAGAVPASGAVLFFHSLVALLRELSRGATGDR